MCFESTFATDTEQQSKIPPAIVAKVKALPHNHVGCTELGDHDVIDEGSG